jgi:hypothetical protein
VTVELPDEFKPYEPVQTAGGGPDLGVLERLLFFAAAWLDAYVIAGAWLAFKVAAKWAAWQHIAKLPPALKDEDDRKYMHARFQLSSNLLGRFLNGTLYNIFCAGMGCVVGNVLLRYSYTNFLPESLWYSNFFMLIGIAALIGLPLIVLPLLGPKRTKKLKAKRHKLWNRLKNLSYKDLQQRR